MAILLRLLFAHHSLLLGTRVSVSDALEAMPMVFSSRILPFTFSATIIPMLPDGYFFLRMNIVLFDSVSL